MSERRQYWRGADGHFLHETDDDLHAVRSTSTEANTALTLDPPTLWVRKDGQWLPLASLEGVTPPPLGNHNLYSISHPDVAGQRTDGDVLVWRPAAGGGSGLYMHEVMADPVARAEFDRRSNARLYDDFAYIDPNLWTSYPGTSMTVTRISALPGRIGVREVGTGAVANPNPVGYGGEGFSILPPGTPFEMTWGLRLMQVDTNTLFRFGLGDAVNSTPNNGLYIEKLPADTSWFAVARSGGVSSRTPLVAATTDWIAARIRYLDASTVEFSIGNTSVVRSSNLPSTSVHPIFAIGNNNVAANKRVQMDFVDVSVTGLSR